MVSVGRVAALCLALLSTLTTVRTGAKVLLVAQEMGPIATRADDARPLATVIMELERRLKTVITYEDPAWDYAPDWRDVTAAVRRDGNMAKRVFTPRGGRFEFVPPAPNGTPESLLKLVLEHYRFSGNDGEFALLQTERAYHIIPTAAKDQLGGMRPYRSLLSRQVTVKAGSRRILEAMSDVVEALNRQSGRQIGIATVPVSLLVSRTVEAGATNEDARSVLMRLMAASGRSLSWRLLCEPGADKLCYFNVHAVD